MNAKKLITALILLTYIAIAECYSQKMVIKKTDHTEDIVMLQTVKRLGFLEGNMNLLFTNGSITNLQLTEIQAIYFKPDSISSIVDNAFTEKLKISPNPALQQITVSNIPGKSSNICIYQMDGQLVLKYLAQSNAVTIPIGFLNSGIYFLVSNGQTIKFFKL